MHCIIATPLLSEFLHFRQACPRQLFCQYHSFPSRSASIVCSKQFGKSLARPRPQFLQLSFQIALERINDLVSQDRKELISMPTTACSQEEIRMVRVIGDEEVPLGPGFGQ